MSSFNRINILLVFIPLFLGFVSCNKSVDSTEKLLQEIEDKYYGKWFKQIKFLQTTNFYKNDSIVRSERWCEEYVYPSQLIIKVDSDSLNNGYLYKDDSVYIFENNKVKYSEKVTHDLVIFSLDIFNMTSEEAYERISNLDYDISKFEKRKHKGKEIYVIGAENGDTTSNQVWFDAEHLYFIKMIKSTEFGKEEVVFNDYIQINGSSWIEQEVVFYLNGKKRMVEKYYNIEIPDVKRNSLEPKDFGNFDINLMFIPVVGFVEEQIDQKSKKLYLFLVKNF